MSKLQIEIAGDAQEVAERMVRIFVSAASEAVSARGVFRTAFSGGRTPEAFFRCLAQSEEGRALPWEKVHVFWVDERYVPPDSPASNYRLVAEALLSRVEIPESNIHRIPTEHPDPAQAARAYERTIREVFGRQDTLCVVRRASCEGGPRTRDEWNHIPQFDLILLGMGQDAHTASLFPGAAWSGPEKGASGLLWGGRIEEGDSSPPNPGRASRDSPSRFFNEIEPRDFVEEYRPDPPFSDPEDLVCAVHAAGVVPPDRITLTPVVLQAARRLVVLVSGSEKARILKEVLTSETDESRYPIHVLRPVQERVLWLVDQAAARELGGV